MNALYLVGIEPDGLANLRVEGRVFQRLEPLV